MRYIKVNEFKDFKRNQERLIGVLNHNTTILKNDVSWLKKLSGWQIGILTGILVAILSAAIF